MSTLTIPKPGHRQEWLEARHPFVNASSCAALFDEHPFLSRADLAAEKLAPGPVDGGENVHMRRGRLLEPACAAWWEEETGVALVEPDVLYVKGRIMATLDRIPVGVSGVGVECKATSKPPHELPLRYWWWQAQAQMHAADLERVEIVAFAGDHAFHPIRVDREEAAIDALVKAADEFMSFIDMGMWPEGVAPRYEHVVQRFPEHRPGRAVELDAEGVALLRRLQAATEVRLQAEKDEALAKAAVADMLGEAEAATYGGVEVATWRNNRPTSRVDYRALESAHPEVVEEFRREVPGARVLRVTRGLGEVAA